MQNSKIKDLAFKAGFVGESMFPIVGTTQETALENFAALIVNACADAADMAHGSDCPFIGDYIVESMEFGTEEGAAAWRT